MLITRPYMSPEMQLVEDLRECGIARCSRKLIFFVDKFEYESGICKVGKMIQINISAESGHLTDSMKSHGIITKNSSQIKCSVYKYDVAFPSVIYDSESLKTSCLVLKDAYSMNEMNDFDEMMGYKDDIGIYNNNVSKNESLLNKLELNGNTFAKANILKPIYYTEDHQKKHEHGEAYDIVWWPYDLVFEGGDLIDMHTIIEIHDIKTYDTMVPMLRNEIVKRCDRGLGNSGSVNFISDLFVPTSESLQNGYVFIYETGKGINVKSQKGITSVPYADFRVKENLISNLQGMVDLIKAEAQLIEAERGHIRLHYCPLMSGDRLDIRYDDYAIDNQPDYNKTTIDKGFTIEDQINEQILEANNLFEEDVKN